METPERNSRNKHPKHSMPKEKKSSNFKPLVIIAVVILVALLCVAVYANTYQGIYPNTYVNGQLVSDMTEEELGTFLSKTYYPEKYKDQSFILICKGNKKELGVLDLGLVFDNEAFAENIIKEGKDGNFFTRAFSFVSHIFKQVDVIPVMKYNKDVLSNAFNEVTEGHEVEPVGYTFDIGDNSLTIHNRISGIKADREKAINEAERQIIKGVVGKIELKPVAVTPEPLDFDEFYAWLTSDAQEAYYEKVDGKVIVRDSKPKCEVNKQDIKNAISELESTNSPNITIPVKTSEPENTSAALLENLYKDKLGSYSTNYGSSSWARANNVRLATSRVDGTELMPGEEFSYDNAILPRTAANGYMEAGVYVGNKVESGMGGGICQPSSTLYAAALYANLEIAERHNHSLTVSYLPPGLDATIAEGYLDLRIKNNTDYPIKISADASGGVVKFSIYGYNDKNVSVDIERSFSNGKYYVTRVVKENGVEVKRESMTSSVYGVPEKDEPEEEKEETTEEGETPEGEEVPPVSDGTEPTVAPPDISEAKEDELAVPPVEDVPAETPAPELTE